jgi:hypothetical protein
LAVKHPLKVSNARTTGATSQAAWRANFAFGQGQENFVIRRDSLAATGRLAMEIRGQGSTAAEVLLVGKRCAAY